jgi:hypothetical protein
MMPYRVGVTDSLVVDRLTLYSTYLPREKVSWVPFVCSCHSVQLTLSLEVLASTAKLVSAGMLAFHQTRFHSTTELASNGGDR